MRPVVTHSTMWVDSPSTMASLAAGSCFLKRSIRGQRELAADARRQPDGHPPDRLVAARAQVLARMRHQLQHRHAVVEQPLARIGQRDAPAVAQEQLLTQLGLQAAHLAAERRLRDVEHHRRLAEAAQFGHLHEVFELLEVHGGQIRTNLTLSQRAGPGRLAAIALESRPSRSPFATCRYQTSAWPRSPRACSPLASMPSSSSRFFTSASASISCRA